MRFRKLRIAWSVAWSVIVVPLCVLWVRSYWLIDNAAASSSYILSSMNGRLFVNTTYIQVEKSGDYTY